MNAAINEKLEKIRAQLVEASEIEVSELPPEHQKFVKDVEKATRTKVSQVFDGIHGNIIGFDGKAPHGGKMRMTKEMVDVITGFGPMRWMEVDGGSITVGC